VVARWKGDCVLYPSTAGALTGLEIVDAYSGQRKALVRSENGVVLHPEWLPDGSELLALYRMPVPIHAKPSIHVSFPGGR